METFLLKVEKQNISTIFVWSKWNPFQTNIYKAEVSFYGIAVWTVLSHLSLPLCIFYRHAMLSKPIRTDIICVNILLPQVSCCCCTCRHLELGLQTLGHGLISWGLFKYWTINNKVVSYLYCTEEPRIQLPGCQAEDKGHLPSDFLASASRLVIHSSSPSPLTNQPQPNHRFSVLSLCTCRVRTYLYHHHITSYAVSLTDHITEASA